ncbi:molybdate transport system permease protein [Rhizobiales bacterium GAS191]|jgi:molybdate transport system permease protein|nr:molybdate transport system permease protein [Rhizobiales bacterium GAS113]SEC28105.1 molybdate transport system permease protein [Rhizobiales bacterium GAS191]
MDFRALFDASWLQVSWLEAPEWEALRLSLFVGLIAVMIALPFAVAGAWFVARSHAPGRGLVNALLHLPLMLPPIVVGYLLLVLLGARGPVGRLLLEAFGLRLAFTTKAVVIATAVMILPIMARAVRLGLDAIDRGLETAARTLGATRLDVFASVTLPLMAPGILTAAAIGFTAALGEFGAVIIFAANIQGETRTLPLAIYTTLQAPGGEAAAARLAVISIGLALLGLGVSEWLGARLRGRLGLS